MTSVTAFGRNARRTSAQSRFRVVIQRTAAAFSSGPAAWSTSPVPSGFVRKSASPGLRARLRPDAVRVHGADDGEPVLRLVVPERVPAGEDRARLAHLRVGRGEDRGDRLLRQILGKLGDREREQRPAAHREDVVQGVRRGDRPEVRRVVDERREEVEREDERGLVVEPVDRGVVGRREPDQQVLGLGGHEPGEELLQARGRVLGRAAAGGDELGELDGHASERYGDQNGARARRARARRPTPTPRSAP